MAVNRVAGLALPALLAMGLPGISLSAARALQIVQQTGNDAALTALNPGVKLPATAISVVHRSDGSGTTFIFTHYLSQVSPEWK